jgi:hypothetical protein
MITSVRHEIVSQRVAVDKHGQFVAQNVVSPSDGFVNNSSIAFTYTQSSLSVADQLSAFSHNPLDSFRSSSSVAPFISFDDVRGYIDSAKSINSEVDPTGVGYVIEARVWAETNTGTTRTIFSTREYDNGLYDRLGWALCLEGESNVLVMYSGSIHADNKVSSGKRLPAEQWHTVSLDVNRTTNACTVYVDGMKYYEFADMLVDLICDDHYAVFADIYGVSTARTLKGIEHHCRLWTRATWQTYAGSYVTGSVKQSYRGDAVTGISSARLKEFSCIPLHDPLLGTLDDGSTSKLIYDTYALVAGDTITKGANGYTVGASFLTPIDDAAYLRTVSLDPGFAAEQYLTACSVQFNKPYDTRAETQYANTVSFVGTAYSPDLDTLQLSWPLHANATSRITVSFAGNRAFANIAGDQRKSYSTCVGVADSRTGVIALNAAFAQVFNKYSANPYMTTRWNLSGIMKNSYTQVWLDIAIPAGFSDANHSTVYHTDTLDSSSQCATWTCKSLLPSPQVIKIAAERY